MHTGQDWQQIGRFCEKRCAVAEWKTESEVSAVRRRPRRRRLAR